jgi:hypothetical protein
MWIADLEESIKDSIKNEIYKITWLNYKAVIKFEYNNDSWFFIKPIIFNNWAIKKKYESNITNIYSKDIFKFIDSIDFNNFKMKKITLKEYNEVEQLFTKWIKTTVDYLNKI